MGSFASETTLKGLLWKGLINETSIHEATFFGETIFKAWISKKLLRFPIIFLQRTMPKWMCYLMLDSQPSKWCHDLLNLIKINSQNNFVKNVSLILKKWFLCEDKIWNLHSSSYLHEIFFPLLGCSEVFAQEMVIPYLAIPVSIVNVATPVRKSKSQIYPNRGERIQIFSLYTHTFDSDLWANQKPNTS